MVKMIVYNLEARKKLKEGVDRLESHHYYFEA